MSGEFPDDDALDDEGARTADADDATEQDRAEQAARVALQRVRAVAVGRGLRPGSRARGRRRVAGEAGPGHSGGTSDVDGREPQALGAGLERLVAERGWQVDVAVGGVMGRWPAVVGPDVAAHCTPRSYEDAVLVVQADSTAWATQVRLLVPTLLRRLAEELGEGVVERVQVLGPAAPSWRRGSWTVRGRGQRDTYG